MDKKERNEEIQSRREFFKNAAKGALPILGAVLLANAPVIARAADSEAPMGCTGSCYSGCTNGCTSCKYTCQGGCKNYACKSVAKG